MALRCVFHHEFGKLALLPVIVLFEVSMSMAQGAAPETAPPLFPGGGLLSHNSIFTTRGVLPPSSNIPATA